ncbi:sensor histidine kinase [Oceanicola sp. D3]|uniref:sensor histidine kinase n=1 Tax=Oceanicola sp. D3 TaxID=2587163 RepID=UPI00111F72B8|nr:sensor histidine kinase [Oceanicola sp. D3]QDC10281.1 sensor histidine kinase [Oceanicola sp. D3]
MTHSLRLRLLLIILTPLLVLGLIVGIWRVEAARQTATEFFDRNLMFTALAVSRDVALLDGDAISPDTERLLGETAGGSVRYHVYAPDGVLVVGYAVPPIPVDRRLPQDVTFLYTDALYKGARVRVLRLKTEASIGGISGTFTTTVWQSMAARNQFALQLALRAGAVIASLIGAVALLVWFGVRHGLKPLTDLEEAISRRSPEDLSPIRRAVPEETQGLVGRLNTLFTKLGASMEAQAAFVSDAAHQLRNPIAGLQALAAAILTAPSLEAARERAEDLAAEADAAGQLANRLLTLERARAESGTEGFERLNLAEIAAGVAAGFAPKAKARGLELEVDLPEGELPVLGDTIMLGEAVTNLLDNALMHGGPGMTKVSLALQADEKARVSVRDNGRGVAASEVPKILSRFGQARSGPGSGLGLSIAEAVAVRHGGTLTVEPSGEGFGVEISLPRAA